MKNIAILFMVLSVLGFGAGSAVNPSVQSPVGSPTAVPSAGQSGLVRSKPNTAGMSGNMVMTGNVGGGKEFKGTLPYGSTFYSRTSYSSVDNFIRRSSYDPLATDRNPGVYTPYYDPRRTVTSMYRAGETGLVAPQLYGQGRVNTAIPTGLPQTRNTPFSLQQQRPLSTSPDDISQIMNRQVLLNPADDVIAKRKRDNLELPDTTIKDTDITLLPEILRPQEIEKPIEKLDDKKDINEEPVQNRFEKIRDQIRTEEEQKQTDQAAEKVKQGDESAAGQKQGSQVSDPELRGRYSTFSQLAEAKASDYMNTAQEFLAQGKFYKAADHFALAAVWKPEDVNAWVGQVSSLFAAGEYMSSAFYLEQAMTLKPQLISEKIPQSLLMQKRDSFENGLVEAQTWQERSQSGELAFLMAYMLLQDGKTERAKDAINKALMLIPDSPAIQNLSQIISTGTIIPEQPGISVFPEKNIVREPNQP